MTETELARNPTLVTEIKQAHGRNPMPATGET
jgi:hypothetical protein